MYAEILELKIKRMMKSGRIWNIVTGLGPNQTMSPITDSDDQADNQRISTSWIDTTF